MAFAHDTEVALAAMAALVNSAGPPEELPDVASLDAFVDHWRWTGSRRRDAAELAQVRALRPRLRYLWNTDLEGAVELVNGFMRDYHALPQVVRHDSWEYHLHATSPEAPLAARMAVEAAMAMVDVVRAGELGRLQVCGALDCDDVLVDLSKNRSRRFCSTTCSNRMNVAAFRARQHGQPPPPSSP